MTMRRIIPFFAAGALLAGCAHSGEQATEVPLGEKAQAALEKFEPVGTRSCINLRTVRSTRIADDTAIIYEVSGDRWFVNRPSGGRCSALQPGRALVTRLTTGNLCSVDIVRVIDPPSPMDYGSCALGPFIEYRKKK
ncbi:hypothetical protein KC8_14850 [Sphingomonas sp. KC8]|nr:hypothetical protein KC8_14850 [Sphingomonas sp. KC8]